MVSILVLSGNRGNSFPNAPPHPAKALMTASDTCGHSVERHNFESPSMADVSHFCATIHFQKILAILELKPT